jgi:type III pantothenate kinase
VTTKKNEYLGGIIMPGVRISLAGLSEAAELLPIIKIKKPQGLIGKDTTASIQNGVVYSVAAACQGIISRFKKKYGSTLKVIATGGDAAFFAEYVSGINKVDCQLTLYGLYINHKQANIR